MTSRSIRPEIGQRLMAARLQRGLAQSEVAHRAGLAPSYLSRIENGHIQPSFRAVMEIAEALGASLHELAEAPPAKGGTRGACPVTAHGHCLLDLIAEEADDEHYSPREVRLIRRFTGFLKQASPERLRVLEVLLEDLTRAADAERSGR